MHLFWTIMPLLEHVIRGSHFSQCTMFAMFTNLFLSLEISLTNNLVTNPSSNRPLDYYREENPFVMSRMSRSERRCCRRGTRAARKGMNCNLGYSVQAGLHIMQDFKRASTGFKLSAKMSSRDSSFMKKAKKCFVKRETSQYYTRCCKEFGVIRSKRNN